MDCAKVGALIRALRLEKGMTQRELAQRLLVSDKAVSKWERGMGCPDVSLLTRLSQVLEVSTQELLRGELPLNTPDNGNMRNTRFCICPQCGSITLSTGGNAGILCCGRRVRAQQPRRADEEKRLTVEVSDGDWYVTGDHPMTKTDYVLFIAFVSGARLEICRQYPEGSLSARFPKREHGQLLWYRPSEGLLYQLL